ncbi:tetratricopeptide repeat protein [Rhodoferax sp.]|uniref:tetratricopeptide repeat protein n=1 Tax=Rhodoferax sp. TaxID=50421 RepID=UPI0025CB8D59|nr:tetratricopeptide repeat protein [Rhodoferax sp.]
MPHTAHVTGDGNTVVQITGDHNTVVLGRAFLTLTRFDSQRRASHSPSHPLNALSPYSRSTRLLGRDDELASLRAFLSTPKPISVRAMVGSGGSGKTRLALELCDQMQTEGWNAGFATSTEADRFLQAQNLSAWGWQKPTLVVMDYAAAKAEALGPWLDELADRTAATPHPLRILLLERSADPASGWWASVFGGGWRALGKLALLDPAAPVPIRPLATPAHRVALLQDMLALASPAPPVALPLHDPAFGQQLMQLSWGGDPLFLMLAAMAMVSQGHGALALGRTDLADLVAQGEIDRLAKLARAHGLTADLVLHLAVCATLAQGLARAAFLPFAATEQQATGWTQPDAPAALFKLLQQALPGPQGIAPVIPDMVGEAMVVRLLQGDEGREAVLRCYAATGHRVAETVIRCVQDFAGVATGPIGWLTGIFEAVQNDKLALNALATSLPTQSMALRELNLRVMHQVLAISPDQPAAETAGAHAYALNNLALAQRALGQHLLALQTAQRALAKFASLAQQWPTVFMPDLAATFVNTSTMHNALGQHVQASQTAQLAVDVYKHLEQQQPGVFTPDLARALGNLANRQSDLGQLVSAAQSAQSAVALLRPLQAQQMDVFTADLAMALTCQSNAHSDLNQHQAALATGQESVDWFRTLAAQRPDIYSPDLAKALNNLANTHGNLLQHAEALQPAQQAVHINRNLAAQRPNVFTPDLALSLNNLALIQRKLGQDETALTLAHQSVQLYCDLAEQLPDVHIVHLANALETRATIQTAMGQHPSALASAQQAVDLYRSMDTMPSAVLAPLFARALMGLARTSSQVWGAAAALASAREAVALLRPEFLLQPEVHHQPMGYLLAHYCRLHDAAGEEFDADLLEPLNRYFNPPQE